MDSLTLTETQDLIERYAPDPYYADAYRRYESPYLPQWCEFFSTLVPGRVVDVGPGWGTMAVWLRSQGWEVDVLDFVDVGFFISQQLLEDTGIRYHQCHVETDDLLPALDADVVLMTQVFSHLRYRPDNAIRRVCTALLKPGGLFLCSNLDEARHPLTQSAYSDWKDLPLPGDGQPVVDDMVTCMFDLAEYRDLLGRCFEEIEVFPDPEKPILFGRCRQPRGTTERGPLW